jgi:hypothetical protein
VPQSLLLATVSTCHCIQPVTVTTTVIVSSTKQDPLSIMHATHAKITKSISQTICPTSPPHASTKHVPRSPHTITRYVSQPSTNMYHASTCTTTCTITSASIMHQTCTIPSINHVPYHVPQPSTVYQHMHQCINEKPQACIIINQDHIPSICLKYIPISQRCASNNEP